MGDRIVGHVRRRRAAGRTPAEIYHGSRQSVRRALHRQPRHEPDHRPLSERPGAPAGLRGLHRPPQWVAPLNAALGGRRRRDPRLPPGSGEGDAPGRACRPASTPVTCTAATLCCTWSCATRPSACAQQPPVQPPIGAAVRFDRTRRGAFLRPGHRGRDCTGGPGMSDIELRHISKRFKDTVALDDVSFNVADGELFVLLGHTGAGKTTTLRIIAGLERQDAGDVLFDGETVNQYTPADRDVAFVFQQYSLYPNKTVDENLAFPLRSPLRRVPSAEIDRRVRDAAEKLRITQLLERKTANLSGGEMQRVSIGRAIVRQPRVFSDGRAALEPRRQAARGAADRDSTPAKTQGSTTLFVTHDTNRSAGRWPDRIGVLLRQERIVQIGLAAGVYDHPTTTFVAQLVGIRALTCCLRARERNAGHQRQRDQAAARQRPPRRSPHLPARRAPRRCADRPGGRPARRSDPDRAARRRDSGAHPLRRQTLLCLVRALRTWQSATRSPSRSTGAGCIFFERAASASRIEVDVEPHGSCRARWSLFCA